MEKQRESFSLVQKFRSIISPDTKIFADRCNIGYWLFRCIPFYKPRTFHYPMGYGGLGGTLPQAIGAKIASPDSQVICIIGDGGIQFTLSELAVAVQENTPIKIIVSNNHLYGAIQAGLESAFGIQNFGTDLTSPDYESVAQAYGIPFLRCTSNDGFLDSLKAEMHRERVCLIEFQNTICDP